MELTAENEAWLEEEGGTGIPINNVLSIGREATNTLVLRTQGVSRCHAEVQVRGKGEFWLVDLGSRNGTWHNNYRILHPVRLQNGDRIAILEHCYVFRQSVSADADPPDLEGMEGLATIPIRQTRELPFWLLIADIENFTVLSQKLSGQDLASFTGQWLQSCQTLIQGTGGRINKYLGDGFFAVWPDNEGSAEQVLSATQSLHQMTRGEGPSFRLVVHRGNVSIGGSPLLAEESFIGKEVNFVFRMEKLSGALRVSPLFSEAAYTKLSVLVPLHPLPAQQLKGFALEYKFFALDEATDPPDEVKKSIASE